MTTQLPPYPGMDYYGPSSFFSGWSQFGYLRYSSTTVPSGASSGATSITVNSGDGAKFGASTTNGTLLVHNNTGATARLQSVSGDVLTLQGSFGITISAGDLIYADRYNSFNNHTNASFGGSNTTPHDILAGDLDFLRQNGVCRTLRIWTPLDSLQDSKQDMVTGGYIGFATHALYNLRDMLYQCNAHGMRVVLVVNLYDPGSSNLEVFNMTALDGNHPTARAGYLTALGDFIAYLDADPVMRETVCVIDCFNEILYQMRYQWGPTLTGSPSNTATNPSNHLSTAFQSAWGGSSYDGGKIEAWIAAAWMNDLMYAAHQASKNFLYTCSEAWSQARILDTNYSNQQTYRAYYLPATTGSVVATTITSGGSSYASAPSVSFSDPSTPGGITAQGTASISGGSVSGITITRAGSGYTSAPTVSFNNSNTGGSGAAAIALVPTTSPAPTSVDVFDQHLYTFHPWSTDVLANLATALTLPRPWFAGEMGPENAYPNMYSPRDTTTVTVNLWWLDHLREYGAAAACVESGSNVLLYPNGIGSRTVEGAPIGQHLQLLEQARQDK